MDTVDYLKQRNVTLAIAITRDGLIQSATQALTDLLGIAPDGLHDRPVEQALTADSVQVVRRLFGTLPADERVHSLELTFIRHSGGLVPVICSGILAWRDGQSPLLHLLLMPLGALSRQLREMHNANEVMSQMLLSAKVAYWCIEFTDAVDVHQPCDEVLRQVFENSSHWRMCNRAMADVYEMPADIDFNHQPVRLYWPRSPANEEFVRRLIAADFCVDGALSVDRRHDGSPAYVENDVRAAISNGRLLRMWGSIRDVSRELRIQHDAQERIEALRRVFDAVPDAVLVMDEHGQPQWRNAAFERTFGSGDSPHLISALLQPSTPQRTWHELALRDANHQVQAFNVHCSNVLIRENVAWTVAVLRSTTMTHAGARELHP